MLNKTYTNRTLKSYQLLYMHMHNRNNKSGFFFDFYLLKNIEQQIGLQINETKTSLLSA